MKILFLEPFYSGSHKAFADGLKEYSGYQIDLQTMPGIHWNWRSRGSAYYFAERFDSAKSYDAIFATSLLRLADYKAFVRSKLPPVIVYFHENQLTYPLAPGDKRNLHHCMSDISTALCADHILFNSEFHKEAFISAAAQLFRNAPDCQPEDIEEKLYGNSTVVYPGITLPETRVVKEKTVNPPLILWNHRWAFDKNPEDFFHALKIVKEKGIRFRLAIMGESSEFIPDAFKDAETVFRDEIVCFGYVESKASYMDWLERSDIIVSTAIQENFGLSVAEGIGYGAMPILPDRLSYPELIPVEYHPDFLYRSRRDLIDRLISMLTQSEKYLNKSTTIADDIKRFRWESVIGDYDKLIRSIVKKQ